MSKEVFKKELAQSIETAIQKKRIKILKKAEFKNFNDFRGLFDENKGNKGIIKTPYKDISVNIPYAWQHFYKNTYNTNRGNIKGAFF